MNPMRAALEEIRDLYPIEISDGWYICPACKIHKQGEEGHWYHCPRKSAIEALEAREEPNGGYLGNSDSIAYGLSDAEARPLLEAIEQSQHAHQLAMCSLQTHLGAITQAAEKVREALADSGLIEHRAPTLFALIVGLLAAIDAAGKGEGEANAGT